MKKKLENSNLKCYNLYIIKKGDDFMRGGKRNGAGRKPLSVLEQKRNRNIYISNELYQSIMNTSFENCNGFSQKCIKLIELGLKYTEFKNKNTFSINEDNIEYNKKVDNSNLTFIDLFAGIGGIRMGFEDENTKCVFSSEWDKFAAMTYEANYGERPHGDITKIDEKDIPDHDVLLAGFPCQPFSNIGKREGFLHETQGTLFFDILRILKKKLPKAFLLENVKGLVTIDNGKTFKTIIKSLQKLKYTVFNKILDAQNFGLAQKRERIMIVGFREDLKIKYFEFPKGNPNKKVPINSILEHNPKGYSISKHLQQNYLFKKDDGKPQIVDFKTDIQVKTLVATYHKIQRLTGTFVKDGETGIRLFSELELKRLMGFPDNFKVPVSRTQMYKQFGNSVAVPMITEVAYAIKKYLNEKQGL